MQEVEHMRKHEYMLEKTQEKVTAQGKACTQNRERAKKRKRHDRKGERECIKASERNHERE